VQLFKEVAKFLPSGKTSHVVANAGTFRPDGVYDVLGDNEPRKPDLKVLGVNIVGSLYTIKLALH
jgi:hypothetical protein